MVNPVRELFKKSILEQIHANSSVTVDNGDTEVYHPTTCFTNDK